MTREQGVTLPKGTKIKIIQKGDNELEIEVESGSHTGQRGLIPASSYVDD